jgi:hypothetical protein
LKLSKELTMKLRTHAREVGATVHGALVAAFTFAGRRLSSNWLTHPVLVVSPVNNRKLLGLEDQCALSIIFPTGAYAPDSEERLWDVARAVKDELTPVRTAQELSTVFSAFRQLMSTSPDVAHIAAFELQVCACEGTAITAAALNATAAWRSPPEAIVAAMDTEVLAGSALYWRAVNSVAAHQYFGLRKAECLTRAILY